MIYFTRSWNERRSTEPRFRQGRGDAAFKSKQDKFLYYYKRGERDFSQKELSYIDLREQNLSQPSVGQKYLDLSGSYLEKAVFIRAKLSNANFSGANLTDADLSHADLSHANLSLTRKIPFSRTSQQVQNLTRVKLNRANLSDANLTGADLAGAILNQANLSRTNLSGANLQGAESQKVDLNDSNLTLVNMYFANLSRANLSNAHLKNAKLSFANLSGANLTHANLCGTDLRCARVSKAIFKDAIYDLNTQFPDKDFNPQKYGLICSERESLQSAEDYTKKTIVISSSVGIKEENPVSSERLPHEELINGNQDIILKKGKKFSKETQKQAQEKTQKEPKYKKSNIRPIVSHEEIVEEKAQAQKIGIKGEFIVSIYLKHLQKKEESFAFEWISQNDPTSPYDFWIYQNGQKILIDVKSTSGAFENIIHISLSELRQMLAGKNRYDIYRVFEIDETNKSAKLRISEDLKDFAKDIIKVFDGLPAGILVDSISVPLDHLFFEEKTWVINY